MLSAYIMTLNSERRLAQVLESVRGISDEVIIIDSGSTDRTLEIARNHGARILHRNFDNFRNQRIYAEEQCTNEWVLAIDSDEVVSDSLRYAIANLKRAHFQAQDGQSIDGYAFRRDWYFRNEKVRNFYPVKTPEYIVRLFKKSRINHKNSRIIHEQVQINDARIQTIDEPIKHFSCDSVEELYSKLELYTRLSADDLQSKGVQANWIRINLYPWLIWFRWHILYGGWKDRKSGQILSKYVRDTIRQKYIKLKIISDRSRQERIL